jgi:hypothetical protein
MKEVKKAAANFKELWENQMVHVIRNAWPQAGHQSQDKDSRERNSAHPVKMDEVTLTEFSDTN